MQSFPAQPSAAVQATRWLAVGSVLALIALSLAWELRLAPLVPGGSRVLAALKAFPLCIPIGGLLRMRLYTYRWLSLFIWCYFIEGIWRAYAARGMLLGLASAEIALALLVFITCVAHVRLRLGSAHDRPPA
jgi:uncharacterized membrane protein